MMNKHMIDISNRYARCSCGKTEKSSYDLAFYKYRGSGSDFANQVCNNCGYNVSAHRRDIGKRSLICSSFTAKSTGHEYDSYYCGCRGWD
jgi:hypothetical protein